MRQLAAHSIDRGLAAAFDPPGPLPGAARRADGTARRASGTGFHR
ncbi:MULTISPECIES: hypothetical protein [unclassified Streptomyces]